MPFIIELALLLFDFCCPGRGLVVRFRFGLGLLTCFGSLFFLGVGFFLGGDVALSCAIVRFVVTIGLLGDSLSSFSSFVFSSLVPFPLSAPGTQAGPFWSVVSSFLSVVVGTPMGSSSSAENMFDSKCLPLLFVIAVLGAAFSSGESVFCRVKRFVDFLDVRVVRSLLLSLSTDICLASSSFFSSSRRIESPMEASNIAAKSYFSLPFGDRDESKLLFFGLVGD
mmetsp:Transcript_36476/g.54475  ORF Transcript_36476/g.54475 Transcript_36476/m.54475 type:complete len:224 (-) Transcript_36476:429-1100(-)